MQIELVKKIMERYSKKSKLESADHELNSSKIRRGVGVMPGDSVNIPAVDELLRCYCYEEVVDVQQKSVSGPGSIIGDLGFGNSTFT